MSDPVTLCAPAKVNLVLAVGERRADGFHELTTVLASLRFGDVVTVTEAPALSLVRDPDPGFPAEEDLCLRAAVAIGEALGRGPGLAVSLAKRIPIAAGLGGGSSDAAAVLVGACRVWGTDTGDPRVVATARTLGADVAFFLAGGCARYEGRGDTLARVLPPADLDVVLVNPGVPASTAAVYAAFDSLPAKAPADPAALEAALESADPTAIAAGIVNDLAEAAVAVAPQAGGVRSWVSSQPGVLAAEVSGSGATVFGVCRDGATAEVVAGRAASRGWWAVATHTSAAGVTDCPPLAGGSSID